MAEYKTLYTLYEENDGLHPDITEVENAERQMEDFLGSMDTEFVFQFDMLVGKLARAYEMQGFLFGLNYARTYGKQDVNSELMAVGGVL